MIRVLMKSKIHGATVTEAGNSPVSEGGNKIDDRHPGTGSPNGSS